MGARGDTESPSAAGPDVISCAEESRDRPGREVDDTRLRKVLDDLTGVAKPGSNWLITNNADIVTRC
jgi:hypothetical protein